MAAYRAANTDSANHCQTGGQRAWGARRGAVPWSSELLQRW